MRQRRIASLWVGSLWLFSAGQGIALARVIGWMNVADLTQSAQLVCKFRILSIREGGTAPETEFGLSGSSVHNRLLAACKVVSTLKGACPSAITIQYPGGVAGLSIDGIGQPKLLTGTVCLGFLDAAGDKWRFHDLDHPNLPACEKRLKYPPKAAPADRLLVELVASARDRNVLVRTAAFMQLAEWFDSDSRRQGTAFKGEPAPRAPTVRQLVTDSLASPDPTVRGLAAILAVSTGWSPGVDRVVSVLESPSTGTRRPSAINFVDRGQTIQQRLIDALDESTRHFNRSSAAPGLWVRNHINRGIGEFDYAPFCHAALRTKAVMTDVRLRSGIANIVWIMEDKRSVPDAVALLDDTDPAIRATAIGALTKLIEGRQEQGTREDALKTQPQDIRRWKEWWRVNQASYERTNLTASP